MATSTGKPIRAIPKDQYKKKERPHQEFRKQLEFVIKPLPHDPGKGKLDMAGAFRFLHSSDGWDWAKEVWSNPENRMTAYVYRQIPVCDFEQSLDDPNPEMGHNISKWESWPFGDDDWNIGILKYFGGGKYVVLFHDIVACRKIAKIEDLEFLNWASYPPQIRVDDVIVDATKNKPFIAWARQAGCLFPNDKGYEKGKFVHVETQRHKQIGGEEDDFMTKGPISDAVAGFVGDVLKERLQPPPQPAVVNPAESSLNTMAASASIDLVRATHTEIIKERSNEQSALLGLVTTMVNKQSEPKNDDGFKLAIESIKAMSEAQVAMLKADRDAMTARMDRLEAMNLRLMQQPAQQQQVALAVDPQSQVLDWLDKQEQIMTRLGYTRRGQRTEAPEPQVEREKSMLETITGALGPIIKEGMQMYSMHMQYTLRMTELSIMQRGGVLPQQQPMQPPMQQQPSPQPQPPPQQQQQSPPQGPEASVNEDVRQEIGPEFDNYVINFHPELVKIDKVICSKFIEGMQAIVQEKAQSLDEQTDIMADHGAMLASWYLEIPNNMHNVLIGFQDILLPVLKTYKPIWTVLRTAPASLHVAFIDGFCHPERLDEGDEDQEQKTEDDIIIPN